MVVVRFQVKCKPEKLDAALAAFMPVVAPSRALDGVVSFDIAQDITDRTVIVATEVFEDKAALERQEALPEVQSVIAMLPEFVAAEPDATIFEVSSSAPWG